MTALTIQFRRAEVTAFWIVLVAVLGLPIAGIAQAVAAPMPWAWAAAGLVVLLPGVLWIEWFRLGVRVWNRLVAVTAQALRWYVLRVCYYVLFNALSSARSTESSHDRPGASRWVPRPRPDASGRVLAEECDERGLGAFHNRGRLWTMALAPVLLLLTLLGEHREPAGPPSGTYTLY